MSALSPSFHKTVEDARALELSEPMAPLSKYPYSDQQLRIIAGVLAGKSNKAIASDLEIALNTVKDHLTRIYKIADVHSRLAFCVKFVGRK